MRTATPPSLTATLARNARAAAVQNSTQAPSNALFSRASIAPGITEANRKYLNSYQNWQVEAKRFARTMGVARFSANVVAASASRVILRIEERNDQGDWVETTDPDLIPLLPDLYNETLGQKASELVRLMAWHYQVAGEGLLVTRDAPSGGTEWWVVSCDAVAWDNPNPGMALVKLHPNGTERLGTAFTVPRDQIIHFWLPDEEWAGLAVSPMTAAMDDLRRYRSLLRYAARQSDSYLAMSGMFWTPSEAHEMDGDANEGEEVPSEGTTPQVDEFDRNYYEWARIAIQDDDRIESVVPPSVHWDKAGGKPEFVTVGRGLDEQGIKYRQEALHDFARDVEIPGNIVASGGYADKSNHWTAWLDQEAFVAAVSPTLDRVCHQDLTMAFLAPHLRLLGSKYDPKRYRIGYDPSPVIAHPDKADKALKAWFAGLLGAKQTLAALGFNEEDLSGDLDLKRLADVLSRFAAGGVPSLVPGPHDSGPVAPGENALPSNPGNQTKAPPEQPPGPPVGPGTSPIQHGIHAALLEEYLPPGFFPTEDNGNGHAHTAAAVNAAKHGGGVMLALQVPPEVAAQAARPDGEPADSMHITLVFLGSDAEALDPSLRETILGVVGSCVSGWASAPTVDLSHVERFTASGDNADLEPCALVDDSPEVYALRDAICTALDQAGIEYSNDHAFRAHATIGYYPPGEGPQSGPLDAPLVFTPAGVDLHWGGDVTSLPFATSPSGAVPPGSAAAPEGRSAAPASVVARLRALAQELAVGQHHSGAKVGPIMSPIDSAAALLGYDETDAAVKRLAKAVAAAKTAERDHPALTGVAARIQAIIDELSSGRTAAATAADSWLAEARLAYTPDQARDYHGRWGEGGPPNAPKTLDVKKGPVAPPDWRHVTAAAALSSLAGEVSHVLGIRDPKIVVSQAETGYNPSTRTITINADVSHDLGYFAHEMTHHVVSEQTGTPSTTQHDATFDSTLTKVEGAMGVHHEPSVDKALVNAAMTASAEDVWSQLRPGIAFPDPDDPSTYAGKTREQVEAFVAGLRESFPGAPIPVPV